MSSDGPPEVTLLLRLQFGNILFCIDPLLFATHNDPHNTKGPSRSRCAASSVMRTSKVVDYSVALPDQSVYSYDSSGLRGLTGFCTNVARCRRGRQSTRKKGDRPPSRAGRSLLKCSHARHALLNWRQRTKLSPAPLSKTVVVKL